VLSSRKNKGLIIILSLLIVTKANSAPTLSDCNGKFVACNLSLSSDVQTLSALEINQSPAACNFYLDDTAAEFLKPPVNYMGLTVSSTRIKLLPSVPDALLMTLTGFLCVSFVKDRKIWLAVLAGLLWLGHAGFASLPQLASHLVSKKQIEQQHSLNVAYACKLNDSTYLRSDIEETQYRGLLHHLAGIPDGKSTFTDRHSSGISTFSQHYQKLYTKAFGCLHKNTHTSLLAVIIEQCGLNPLFNFLASRAKHSVYFSPEFTLANIPRGPPKQA